jgi:hypothetical protein
MTSRSGCFPRSIPSRYAVLTEVGAGSWHPERDARSWVRFCIRAHYHQALTLLRRSREMNLLWDAIEVKPDCSKSGARIGAASMSRLRCSRKSGGKLKSRERHSRTRGFESEKERRASYTDGAARLRKPRYGRCSAGSLARAFIRALPSLSSEAAAVGPSRAGGVGNFPGSPVVQISERLFLARGRAFPHTQKAC